MIMTIQSPFSYYYLLALSLVLCYRLVGRCRVPFILALSTSLVLFAPRDKAASGTALDRFRPNQALYGA